MTCQVTDAQSSGVQLDAATLKRLTVKKNGPGAVYLVGSAVLLALTGYLLHRSLGTAWVVPAMALYGGIMTTSAYALSHEASHRTAFKTRWLNDALFFLTSLIYFEETHYRRYAHTRHHHYTWIRGKDAQIPWEVPMTLRGYLYEISGLPLYIQRSGELFRHSLGRFDPWVRTFVPEGKLPKLQRGAQMFLLVYLAVALAIALGEIWLLVYLVIPRVAGGPFMSLITLIQHAEMEPDVTDLRRSTRSFRTNALVRLIYWNMNHHVEHHLYPTVPFHALPHLSAEIASQLPKPDPGWVKTNVEVARAVFTRALPRLRAANQPPT